MLRGSIGDITIAAEKKLDCSQGEHRWQAGDAEADGDEAWWQAEADAIGNSDSCKLPRRATPGSDPALRGLSLTR